MRLMTARSSIWILFINLLCARVAYARPTVSDEERAAFPIHEGQPSRRANTRPHALSMGVSSKMIEVLHKRAPPGLPPLYPVQKFKVHQTSFTATSGILSVNLVGDWLQKFFMSILNNVRPGGMWSSTPEERELAIVEGCFRYSFQCVGDTIPWSFVEHFTKKMWMAASLGVAHLFETIYASETRQIWVRIALTIIDPSTMGSSSSSNEGSSPDWREGSVPSVNFP